MCGPRWIYKRPSDGRLTLSFFLSLALECRSTDSVPPLRAGRANDRRAAPGQACICRLGSPCCLFRQQPYARTHALHLLDSAFYACRGESSACVVCLLCYPALCAFHRGCSTATVRQVRMGKRIRASDVDVRENLYSVCKRQTSGFHSSGCDLDGITVEALDRLLHLCRKSLAGSCGRAAGAMDRTIRWLRQNVHTERDKHRIRHSYFDTKPSMSSRPFALVGHGPDRGPARSGQAIQEWCRLHARVR